jgi:hypothetical protein
MERFWANLFSLLFHPVFMPLYVLLIFFYSDWYLAYTIYPQLKKFLLIITFLLTVFMPSLSTWLLVRNKMVSNFSMPHRNERTLPFLITVFYYGVMYYFIWRISKQTLISPYFFAVISGSMVLILLLVAANFIIKISAHAAATAALAGMYIALCINNAIIPNTSVLLCLIILWGLVSTARLSLKTHNPNEIYLGSLAGFVSMFYCVKYLLVF